MKKGGIDQGFVFLLLAMMVVFAGAAIVAKINADSANRVTGFTIEAPQDNIIQVPNSNQEVPNEDEGSIVLWTKPPIQIFDQFKDVRDYIVFFTATNMPGVRVVYNIREQRFEAGSPLMESTKIDIFDGNAHQIVYTYKKDGEQAIMLDTVKVASSEFKPIKITQITGFATYGEDAAEIDISGIEVAVYDREISDASQIN